MATACRDIMCFFDFLDTFLSTNGGGKRVYMFDTHSLSFTRILGPKGNH
jgi:hypothetical protein